MNLLNSEQIYESNTEKTGDKDKNTFGEIFAISVLILYTIAALVVSSWSAILMYTGNTDNGSPIGFIFNMIIWPMIS